MLEVGYIGLSVVMVIVILLGYNGAMKIAGIEKNERSKKLRIPIIGLLLWFVYIYFIVQTGWLQVLTLPPRFPIFLIFPVFIFTGIFLYKNRNNSVLHAIPKQWTVWYQSFRIIIESLFVGSVAVGMLQPEVTFEGYNYDILFGVSAVIVGLLVYVFRLVPEKFVLYWNYLGLAVIVFIIYLFTTTTYFPSVWGSEVSLMEPKFFQFYSMLVPAFLMPSAVFVHILSIIRFIKKD